MNDEPFARMQGYKDAELAPQRAGTHGCNDAMQLFWLPAFVMPGELQP